MKATAIGLEHTYVHEIWAAILTDPSSPGCGFRIFSQRGHLQNHPAAPLTAFSALTQRKETAIY